MGTRKRSRSRAGSARHRGIGILFWLCLAGVAVAAAIAAREPLTAAWEKFRGEPVTPVAPQVTVRPLTESEGTSSAPTELTSPATNTGSGSGAGAATTTPAAGTPPSASSSSRTSPPAAQPAARKARLFFTTVDAKGAISLKSVIRPIPASDSPLRDTVVALLKGPTAQELNLGLVSMVPAGAALRGAVMRGDTAELSFSESFRFNSQGIEAMNAQLKQIVYAATEFPTVRQVQFLIEGKKVTWLGTEGARIDRPLTRESFQK